MSKTLGKLEKVVLFCGFLVMLAGLVGGAYFLASQTPHTAVAMEPIDSHPPAVVAAAPAIQAIVFASETPEPFTGDDWSWQAWRSSLRQESPVAPVVEMPLPTAPKRAAAAAVPAEEISPPYEINLPAARVIHMYTGEETDGPCWYELKLDPPQVDLLRAAAATIAKRQGAELDELDHLAELPPNPANPLRWWRPGEITDPNLLCLADEKEKKLWIGISCRTGRVFLFASHPIQFSAS